MTTSRDGKSIDAIIGSRLRTRRTQLGLSQEQLASAIGVSYQQIQRYENGVGRMTVSRLLELARKLEMPVGQLLDGLGDVEAAPEASVPRLSKGQLELAHGFGELRDEGVRAALAGLVRTVVERQG